MCGYKGTGYGRGLIRNTVAIAALAGACGQASATGFEVVREWRVPGDFASVQGAIDAAGDGDRIVVQIGVYREHLDFAGKAIEVVAAGDRDLTRLVALDTGRPVVDLEGPRDSGDVARLIGFTVEGGVGVNGGGVFASGDVEIVACVFTDNYAERGGAVFAVGDVDIEDSVFVNNEAAVGGGGVHTGLTGSVRIVDSVFEGNVAAFGAGVYSEAMAFGDAAGAMQVVGGEFSLNIAEQGAALFASLRDLAVRDTLFTMNHANVSGGAVHVQESLLSLEGARFRENSAVGSGGAVCTANASGLTVVDTAFLFNIGDNGGAIHADTSSDQAFGFSAFCQNGSPQVGGGYETTEFNLFGCTAIGLCLSDVVTDGSVNSADLLAVLRNFGTTGNRYDISGDGIVGGNDLIVVLRDFGLPCDLDVANTRVGGG